MDSVAGGLPFSSGDSEKHVGIPSIYLWLVTKKHGTLAHTIAAACIESKEKKAWRKEEIHVSAG